MKHNLKYLLLKTSLYTFMLRLHNLFAEYFISTCGIYNGKYRIKPSKNPHNLIRRSIENGKPIMISRLGTVEFRFLVRGDNGEQLCKQAGFFPSELLHFNRFKKLYLDSMDNVDILAIWNYRYHGLKALQQKKNLIKNYSNINSFLRINDLSTTNSDIWVKALKDKRLLIIHPFKKSIEHQIAKGSHFFNRDQSIVVYEAIQTIADSNDMRFTDWFEALNFMMSEISDLEFDVCLLGCGAYGLPLASHIKNLGRQSLHIGGSLQLFFKLKGARWDNLAEELYTSDWVYPLEADRPKGYISVEDGCYW